MNIADLQKGIADLQTDFQHTQAIALGSAYVTMKCLSGEKQAMNKWMKDIEKCVMSGGQNCAPIKGIAAANLIKKA